MSKKSRERTRKAGQKRGSEKNFHWLVIILLVASIGIGFGIWKKRSSVPQPINLVPANAVPAKFPPANFLSLCALPTNDIARCDIALMNLLCAEGLPGAENLDIPKCMTLLENFAKFVKQETVRHLYRFRERPADYKNSEGYFRMMMMATVLQQDLGIHYNPDHIQLPGGVLESDEKFFANSQDIFIHGLTHEKGIGTCSSMPVFYVAVGRRLGYPLKLVTAKGHLFARWDEGDKSFNIEATSIGFVSFPDDYYRSWPVTFTLEEEIAESYLKSLTPTQELAVFLSIRGHCLRAQKDYLKALGAFAQAFYKEPQSVGYQKLFARAEYEAFKAGVLPKRAELQFAIQSLEIPPSPLAAYYVTRKAELDQKNQAEVDPVEIERELQLLRIEMSTDFPSPRRK